MTKLLCVLITTIIIQIIRQPAASFNVFDWIVLMLQLGLELKWRNSHLHADINGYEDMRSPCDPEGNILRNALISTYQKFNISGNTNLDGKASLAFEHVLEHISSAEYRSMQAQVPTTNPKNLCMLYQKRTECQTLHLRKPEMQNTLDWLNVRMICSGIWLCMSTCLDVNLAPTMITTTPQLHSTGWSTCWQNCILMVNRLGKPDVGTSQAVGMIASQCGSGRIRAWPGVCQRNWNCWVACSGLNLSTVSCKVRSKKKKRKKLYWVSELPHAWFLELNRSKTSHASLYVCFKH